MKHQPNTSYAASGFFVLRTPLLPARVFDELVADLEAPQANEADLEGAIVADCVRVEGRVRALLLDFTIREALFFASPTLDDAIGAWLNEPQSTRARDVLDISLRYLARMSRRPTPFGLFSGCSVGSIGDETVLSLGARSAHQRRTRLDMHYLTVLAQELGMSTALRSVLRYVPSSSLYAVVGQLRYAEVRIDSGTRALVHQVVAVDPSQHLTSALKRANGGAPLREIAAAIPGACPRQARAFVDELVDAKILVPELEPLLTGEGNLTSLIRILGESKEGEIAARVQIHHGCKLIAYM